MMRGEQRHWGPGEAAGGSGNRDADEDMWGRRGVHRRRGSNSGHLARTLDLWHHRNGPDQKGLFTAGNALRLH